MMSMRTEIKKRIILTGMMCICVVFANHILQTSNFKFQILSAQNVQEGKASFYAKKFTGRRTASGERLHHDSLTCAHKTYPFGTLLKVTNPANGQSVVVRVTDRGPYVKGRIIDLSVRAAREIGIIAQGIAPVVVERYAGIIPPFKADENLELPDFELGTNEGSEAKPVWVALKEDRERKIQQRKEREQEVLRKKTLAEAEKRTVMPEPGDVLQHQPAVGTEHRQQKTSEDVLHDINKNPNNSKAYLKRQGR